MQELYVILKQDTYRSLNVVQWNVRSLFFGTIWGDRVSYLVPVCMEDYSFFSLQENARKGNAMIQQDFVLLL